MLDTFKKALGSLLGGIFLLGCESAPPPPTVADLSFPVLVIYPDAGHDTFDNAESLHSMSMQRVLFYKDTPLLIDTALRIYGLAELKSTKGGLSLMITGGSGRTPVSFKLQRTNESGIAAVRAAVRQHCSRLRDGPSAESRREQLAAAETLTQVIAVIDAEP